MDILAKREVVSDRTKLHMLDNTDLYDEDKGFNYMA